jgi:hypothetical protein
MSLDPSKPKQDDRPISSIVWRCGACRNIVGNFAHRGACAECGEPKPASPAK